MLAPVVICGPVETLRNALTLFVSTKLFPIACAIHNPRESASPFRTPHLCSRKGLELNCDVDRLRSWPEPVEFEDRQTTSGSVTVFWEVEICHRETRDLKMR